MRAGLMCYAIFAAILCVIVSAKASQLTWDLGPYRIVVPDIFDFDRFALVHGRVYASAVERMARCRMYLARAMQAFLSFVGYKKGLTSSYQAPNRLSDRTPEELKQIFNYAGEDGELLAPNSESKLDEPAIADLPAIENELLEMTQKDDELGLGKLIARELGLRADSHEPTDQGLSVQDLAPEPQEEGEEEPVEVLAKIPQQVESNNPHYEAPEMTSCGLERSGSASKPLGYEQAKAITDSPVGRFMSNLISSAAVSMAQRFRANEEARDDEVTYVDHRQDACLLQPRDQGDCGCCYVFAAISYLEWLYCTSSSKLASFSEQYPLDCGRASNGLYGCQGGNVKSVLHFVNDRGIELEQNYPFREAKEECPYDDSIESDRMGYLRLDEPASYRVLQPSVESDLKRLLEVLERKPLIAGLKVITNTFLQYKGGVDEPDCRTDFAGHALLLVGHGRERGRDFWLFRNSFGHTWGEHGYYKLSKASRCFTFALDVTAKLGHKLNENYHVEPITKRYVQHLLLN